MDRNYHLLRPIEELLVVPYVGTWIEIRYTWLHEVSTLSRSLRGNVDRNICRVFRTLFFPSVVPYVGTWIEIRIRRLLCPAIPVVPYVGTWIEIRPNLPEAANRSTVVPYVGTWIEINRLRS